MRTGGNNFIYFPEYKLIKLANLVQFKRMLMFCLEDWRAWAHSSCLRHWAGGRRSDVSDRASLAADLVASTGNTQVQLQSSSPSAVAAAAAAARQCHIKMSPHKKSALRKIITKLILSPLIKVSPAP